MSVRHIVMTLLNEKLLGRESWNAAFQPFVCIKRCTEAQGSSGARWVQCIAWPWGPSWPALRGRLMPLLERIRVG